MADKKIAWQNKDIIAKILSEKYKDKSFSVYGIDLPKIKEVRPTGLPDMVVDEVNMDHYFYLEDASIAITEYESQYKKGNWKKRGKQQMVEHVVELAIKMEDGDDQKFVIAAILANADKFIDLDYAEKVRKMLTMTKVGKIIQREIQDAVDKKEKEMEEEVRKKEAEVKEKEAEVSKKEQEKQKALLDTARSLLDLLPPEQIAEKFNLPLDLILNQNAEK